MVEDVEGYPERELDSFIRSVLQPHSPEILPSFESISLQASSRLLDQILTRFERFNTFFVTGSMAVVRIPDDPSFVVCALINGIYATRVFWGKENSDPDSLGDFAV